MAHYINEHFVLKGAGCEMEMYANAENEIFVSDKEDEGRHWFVISKGDWEAMKKFIDKQLENK